LESQNQLEQQPHKKKYYLNKPLKHLSNQFIGQVEANTFTDLIIGLKGAGKTTFIKNLLNDPPLHWRLCIINAKTEKENLTEHLLKKFELDDKSGLKTATLKQHYLQSRFKQAIQLGLKIVIIIDNAEELSQNQLDVLQSISQIVKLVFVANPEIEKLLSKNQESGLFYKGHFIPFGLFAPNDISKFIKRRLANIAYQGRFPFSEADIEKIYTISKGNPFLVKTLCNQGLKHNSIPLPSLAETRSIYNEIKDQVKLSEYTDLSKIEKVKEVHSFIREKGRSSKAKKKKSPLKLSIFLLTLAFSTLLGFIYLYLYPTKTITKYFNSGESITTESEALDTTLVSKSSSTHNSKLNLNSDKSFTSEISVNKLHEKKISPPPSPKSLKTNQESIYSVTTSAPSGQAIKQDKITNPYFDQTINAKKENHQVIKDKTPISPTQNNDDKVQSNKYLLGYQWLQKQPDSYFTIQLLGSRDYNKLLNSLNALNIGLPLAIVGIKKRGRIVWYSAFAGSYKTKLEAKKAIKRLPSRQKKYKPWPRTFKAIKK